MIDEFLATIPAPNNMALCIGPISTDEGQAVRIASDAQFCDGRGLYLYLVDRADPKGSIDVLARVMSSDAGHRLAELLRNWRPQE